MKPPQSKVQTDATTPNIVAPTILRVVASVSSCVQADEANPNNTQRHAKECANGRNM